MTGYEKAETARVAARFWLIEILGAAGVTGALYLVGRLVER